MIQFIKKKNSGSESNIGPKYQYNGVMILLLWCWFLNCLILWNETIIETLYDSSILLQTNITCFGFPINIPS